MPESQAATRLLYSRDVATQLSSNLNQSFSVEVNLAISHKQKESAYLLHSRSLVHCPNKPQAHDVQNLRVHNLATHHICQMDESEFQMRL